MFSSYIHFNKKINTHIAGIAMCYWHPQSEPGDTCYVCVCIFFPGFLYLEFFSQMQALDLHHSSIDILAWIILHRRAVLCTAGCQAAFLASTD